jgi:hypothetical protein
MKSSNRDVRLKFFWGMLVWSVFTFLFGMPLETFGQMTFDPGTFQGVLRSDSNNDESFGFITIVLTATGKFSMRFNLGVNRIGHHSYSKTGTFDQNGAYHFEGPQETATSYAIARIIDLQFTSPTAIQGTVSDFTHSSTVELERVAVFTSDSPAPGAGRYTFLFSNSSDPSLPSGFGYGTAIMNSRGKISAGGRSADEMRFSQRAALTVSGRWPVFAKLGGSTKGILCGWLTFAETAESDFAGSLTWLGPEVPGPNNAFVNEFSGDVSCVGSRFSAPRGSTVLQTISSTNNVRLTLSGGGLETPIERDLTLSSANRFTFANRMPEDSLSVSASTGIFTGRFLHSNGLREIFRGAILKKQNFGAGHFVDHEGKPGTVELQPQ